MKRWAVGFVSFFDNQMSIIVTTASSWHEAADKHPKIAELALDYTDLETAKQHAFDQDAMIDVVEFI